MGLFQLLLSKKVSLRRWHWSWDLNDKREQLNQTWSTQQESLVRDFKIKENKFTLFEWQPMTSRIRVSRMGRGPQMRWKRAAGLLTLIGHGRTSDFMPSATGNHWRDLTREWHDMIVYLKAPSSYHVAMDCREAGREGKEQRGGYYNCLWKMWWWLGPGGTRGDSGNSLEIEQTGLCDGPDVGVKERKKSRKTPSLGRPALFISLWQSLWSIGQSCRLFLKEL